MSDDLAQARLQALLRRLEEFARHLETTLNRIPGCPGRGLADDLRRCVRGPLPGPAMRMLELCDDKVEENADTVRRASVDPAFARAIRAPGQARR